jgi:hypothetical protein
MTLQEFYNTIRPIYQEAKGKNLLPFEFDTLIKHVNLLKWEKERKVFEEDQRNIDTVQWMKSAPTALTFTDGKVVLPSDYGTKAYIQFGTGTSIIDVEIVQEDALALLQRNSLYPPSATEPVCVIRAGYLYVYPATVATASMVYLKKPMPPTIDPEFIGTEPKYAFKEDSGTGLVIYDSANSVEFGWPVTEHADLLRIALQELNITTHES